MGRVQKMEGTAKEKAKMKVGDIVKELNKAMTFMISKEGDAYSVLMQLKNKLLIEDVAKNIKRRQSRERAKQKKKIKKLYGIR